MRACRHEAGGRRRLSIHFPPSFLHSHLLTRTTHNTHPPTHSTHNHAQHQAEDILQFAARHYGLRCIIYRLPFISANSRALFGTGYAKARVVSLLCIHGVMCCSFSCVSDCVRTTMCRLPPHTHMDTTHLKQDLILVRLLQCIQDSGLLPQELAQQQTYIISADASAKVCAHARVGVVLSNTLVCV